jgi:hypothetical protein
MRSGPLYFIQNEWFILKIKLARRTRTDSPPIAIPKRWTERKRGGRFCWVYRMSDVSSPSRMGVFIMQPPPQRATKQQEMEFTQASASLQPTDTMRPNLSIRLDSYIPIKQAGEYICLPGFAGDAISIEGNEVYTSTYYDLGNDMENRATISLDQENQLRSILLAWNTESPSVPWEPSTTYCAYDVNTGLDGVYSYRWDNKIDVIPQCVADLVALLHAIVAQISPGHSSQSA